MIDTQYRIKETIQRIVFLLIILISALSCQKVSNNQPAASGNYINGVWIADEGNFTYGNAAIDFYHKDKDTLERNVFENVNGHPLDDVLQCMYHYYNSYYLVLN